MRLRVRAAGVLIIWALAAGTLAPLAPAAPAAQAAATATSAPLRYFEVGNTMELANDAQTQSVPELVAMPSGDFALAYFEGIYTYSGVPSIEVHNGTTGARTAGLFSAAGGSQYDSWANTTARGAYTAVDGTGRLLRVSWGFAFPSSAVSLSGYNATGAASLGPVSVGTTPYYTSAAAIAVGRNNTVHVVHYDGQVRYSVLRANGTWAVHNVSVQGASSGLFPPHIVYDAAAGRMVIAWSSPLSGATVMAVEPNGSVAWTYPFTMSGANMTLAALPSGDVVVVYVDNTAMRALRLDRDGALAAGSVAIEPKAAGARAPRATVMSGSEVAVVYSDYSDGSDLDVFAMAFDASTMSATIPATRVSSDRASNSNPAAAFLKDGSLWVSWQNETTYYYANISGARLVPRWSGFSLEASEASLQIPRGEPVDVAVKVSSLVNESTDYDLSVGFYPYGGPTNWTGTVMDAAGALPSPALSLGASVLQWVTMRIDAPVVDPSGYGAIALLLVTDHHRGGPPLALRVNITVVQGHRFAVSPSDANVTALPGGVASLSFDVRAIGTVAEAGVPMAVSAPPPAGWSLSLQPANLTAAVGEGVNVTLSVGVPGNAPSGQTYCARLRVQHPNDPFSLATAGFCVRVALVAAPTLDPPALAQEVEPGGAALSVWTLTNVGNAASPISCAVGVEEELPAGWQSAVDPDSAPLGGGGSATAVLSVTAAPLALGGMTVNLTLSASCVGGSAYGVAHLRIVVRDVHLVQWRAAGISGDASASGASTFTVSAENQGNVREPVSVTIDDAPPGWEVHSSLTVAGAPATAVAPYDSGTVSVLVQAPPNTLADTYLITVSLVAGDLPPQGVVFSVRVPKAYGVEASFTASPAHVGPDGQVRVVGAVRHTGNTADTYTLRVDVADLQSWGWRALYRPDGGNESELHGSLLLAALENGTLTITITAPREPVGFHIAIKVNLSSARGPSAEFVAQVDVVLPDLTIEVTGDPSGREGEIAVQLQVVVANRGEAASGATQVVVRLDGADQASGPVRALQLGETAALWFNFTATLRAGAHEISVVVDPGTAPGASPVNGRVFERNEANNLASVPFALEAAPPTNNPPPSNVNTIGSSSTALIVIIAMAAGTAALVVVRLRMGRRRQ